VLQSCSDTQTDTKEEKCSPQFTDGTCENPDEFCDNGICIKKEIEGTPACSSNQICKNGMCEDKEITTDCTPNEFLCVNNNMGYKKCDENGYWLNIVNCNLDEICNQETKACETQNPNECNPNQKKCSLDLTKIETCNTDGTGWDETTCQEGETCSIDNGEVKCTTPTVNCEPNQKICSGYTEYQECNNDGTALSEPINCHISEASGELTQCFDGICKDECQIASDKRSYIGCEYYAIDLDNTSGIFRNDESQTPHYYSIIVSNPSAYTASVTITDNNGYSVTRDVASNAIEIFEVGTLAYLGTTISGGRTFYQSGDNHQIIDTARGTRYSYKITSNMPIIAYQFSPLGGSSNYSNDASMLIPIAAYDKEYKMISWEHWEDNSQTMTIIAKEDNTSVDINFKAPTKEGNMIPAQSAGNTYNVVLSKGETIQFASSSGDLTGSHISADKEIGVFGGHSCTNIPNDKTACDHIEEQLFPLNTWGAHYQTVSQLHLSIF
jgi:hypothetical protein